MNFLEETIKKIESKGKAIVDVHHVIVFDKKKNDSVCVTWETFRKIAKDVVYDPGYGTEEIYVGCKVVFNDGSWLERREYDGSEWWTLVEVEPLDVEITSLSPFLSVRERDRWR